jgi:hypothetical protein
MVLEWRGARPLETNGQVSVLILRDGVPIGLTIDASVEGINEIMWFLRPSELAAILKSDQRSSDGDVPVPAAAWRSAPIAMVKTRMSM